ncbi:unnamed protein product [Cunninghamella echinulata]
MENPFLTTDSDYDPIMIAARLANQSASPPLLTPSTSLTTNTATSTTKTIWRHSRNKLSDVPLYDTLPLGANPLTIIALGKTGDGKFSLLNDILGHQVFQQKTAVKSQTQDVIEQKGFWAPLNPYMHGKETFGCHVRVFDTPGFGDSNNRDHQFIALIKQRIMELSTFNNNGERNGIHCFLMVFKVTASEDQIFKSLDIVKSLLKKCKSFWKNVILVFTHADLATSHRFQSNKVALQTTVNQDIKDRYQLDFDLPMIFLSTQRHTCSFLKGFGTCDCERGHRYNANTRRRLYEQVWKRRSDPFYYEPEEDDDDDDDDDEAKEDQVLEDDDDGDITFP